MQSIFVENFVAVYELLTSVAALDFTGDRVDLANNTCTLVTISN